MNEVASSTNLARGHALSRDEAIARIVRFTQRFGEAHFTLACHAAFSLALTPDLLYQIWAHFVPEATWTAVADVLLSPLCSEVGNEIYEMDQMIRALLLEEMREDQYFGEKRINNLAAFVAEYAIRQLRSDDPNIYHVAQTHRWVALAYTQPNKLASELAELLRDGLVQRDKITQLRVTTMAHSLAKPLAGYQDLLTYALSINALIRGKNEDAQERIAQIGLGRTVSVEGIQLPSFLSLINFYEEDLTELQYNLTQSAPGDLRHRYTQPINPRQPTTPFVNRERELEIIHRLISEQGTLRVLCIQGPGGIGKSRLLQEVFRYAHEAYPHLLVGPIIDFGDPVFHHSKNIEYLISHELNTQRSTLRSDALENFSSKEGTEESHSCESFAKYLNNLNSRMLLFFDSTDSLEDETIPNYLANLAANLTNAVLLIAGRDSGSIHMQASQNSLEEAFALINLSNFSRAAMKEYIQEKAALLHIDLSGEMEEKLILLSDGRPILIDMAVEKTARNMLPYWFAQKSVEELRNLYRETSRTVISEFEQWLVSDIASIRTPRDQILLLMSQVYPIDQRIVQYMLNLSAEEASDLLERVSSSVFVINLAYGRVRLQDEFRRLLNEHVWPWVDPTGEYRKRYNSFAVNRLTDIYSSQMSSAYSMERDTQISEMAYSKDEYQRKQDLETSLRYPEPSLFVDREHELSDILIDDKPVSCILIEAPAGYGKTAFLRKIYQLYQERGWLCAYISVQGGKSISEITKMLIEELKIPLPEVDTDDARQLGRRLGYVSVKQHVLDHATGLVLLIDDFYISPTAAIETSVSEFIRGILESLTNSSFFNSNNRFRVLLSGRRLNDMSPTEISWRFVRLTPFDHQSVRLMLERRELPDYDYGIITSLAADILHHTAGHPGGIARTLGMIDKQGHSSLDQRFFLNAVWENLMYPISRTVLSYIDPGYRKILSTLSVFRYLDVAGLKELMDNGLLSTNENSVYGLVDSLSANHFLTRRRGLLTEFYYRILLALRLSQEEPEVFVEYCNIAKNIYFNRLEATSVPRDLVRWGIEAMFQSLQQYTPMISSLQERRALSGRFYEEVVPRTLQLIENELLLNSEDISEVKQILEYELSNDEEFHFTINYYLRRDQYDNEPYGRLHQQIGMFFDNLDKPKHLPSDNTKQAVSLQQILVVSPENGGKPIKAGPGQWFSRLLVKSTQPLDGLWAQIYEIRELKHLNDRQGKSIPLERSSNSPKLSWSPGYFGAISLRSVEEKDSGSLDLAWRAHGDPPFRDDELRIAAAREEGQRDSKNWGKSQDFVSLSPGYYCLVVRFFARGFDTPAEYQYRLYWPGAGQEDNIRLMKKENEARAVLVGINQHSDPSIINPKVCVENANIIQQILTKHYKVAKLITDATSGLLPTRSNILAELSAAAQATSENDLLLFYFSGHGVAYEGESYLLTRDTRFSELKYTSIAVSDVLKVIKQSSTHAKVIILDVGHFGRNEATITSEFLRPVFEQAEGTAILTSCKQNQQSWEWHEKQCSVFTHYLLEALAGQADFDSKGFVTLYDVSRYVINSVKVWALKNNVVQTPVLQYNLSGDVVLLRNTDG